MKILVFLFKLFMWLFWSTIIVVVAIAFSGCNRHTETTIIAHTVNVTVDAEAKVELKAVIP